MNDYKCAVVVVDDEPMIEEYVEAVLARSGIKHFSFTDPKEALQFLRENHHDIHLLITDVRMPQMNGIALAKKAMGMNPNLPVLLLTGDSLDSVDDLDAYRILHKPVLRQELMQAVETAIGDRCRIGKD